MNNKFKEMGHYLIQSGLYLTTIKDDKFEEDNLIHDNIIGFLMQAYLYLKTYNKQLIDTAPEIKAPITNEDPYLSRKEVLNMYRPLFTEYGLTQAIHTRKLPYIKRGSKYFFKKSEIDDWIAENNGKSGNKRIKYV